MLDLGLIGRHNYYTGAVYEVYASGLGFTLANGGRYDNLLMRFGRAASGDRLRHLPGAPPLRAAGRGAAAAAAPRRGYCRATRAAGDACAPAAFPCCTSPRTSARGRRGVRSCVEAAWICYPAPRRRQARPADRPGESVLTDTGPWPRMVLS